MDDWCFNIEDGDNKLDPWSAASIGDVTIINEFGLSSPVINAKNSEGWTPLMYASCKGFAEIVSHLLRRGVSVAERDSHGRTCLMLAVGSGDLNSVKSLCTSNCLEQVDCKGWTALFYAVWYRREACVKLLLSAGADPKALNFRGESPALVAQQSGIESIIAIFGESTMPGNQQDSVMISPLSQLAVQQTPSKQDRFFTRSTRKGKHVFSPNIKSNGQKENKSPHTPNYKANHLKMGSFSVPSKLKAPQKLNNFNVDTNKSIKVDADLSPLGKYLASKLPATVQKSNPSLPMYTVQTFLQQLKLDKYWPLFRDEEVDFETFLTFEEQNLFEIGMNCYGPRFKVLSALREYKEIYGKPSPLLKHIGS